MSAEHRVSEHRVDAHGRDADRSDGPHSDGPRADTPRVERLRLPDSVEGPEAADFREYSELADAISGEVWGHHDRCEPAAYRLVAWRDTEYRITSQFFARDGGRMVGRAWCEVPLMEDTDRAMVHAEVLEEHSRRGLGRLLLAAATEEARRHGRTVLNTFTEHRLGFDEKGPQVVVPSTGTGALPADSRAVAFARAAGFELSQVERVSELVLEAHDAAWRALEAEAAARAGDAYQVLLWAEIPPGLRAEMAVLLGRMSTDVPYGADRYEAAIWDADRVAAMESRLAEAGTRRLHAVARHRASGRLVAYTTLWIPGADAVVAEQDDTLVVAEHRGHRLGMLLKLANLRALRSQYPGVRKVITSNAEENGHMLAINAALGFRPAGYEGEWYRRTA